MVCTTTVALLRQKPGYLRNLKIPPKPLPDQSVLLDLFNYNVLTGELCWAVRDRKYFKTDWSHKKFNEHTAGKPALISLDGEGYMYGAITLDGKRTFYKAHRIIWKYVHNEEPEQLDHDNRVRTDNRISNLKSSNATGNARNRRKRVDNRTGVTGVHQLSSGKFRAFLGNKHLGNFDTIVEAEQARNALLVSQSYNLNHGK